MTNLPPQSELNEIRQKPFQGETFRQYRDLLLRSIESTSHRVRLLGDVSSSPENARLAEKVAIKELKLIDKTWNEIRELQSWFNKSDLKADEPYRRKL